MVALDPHIDRPRLTTWTPARTVPAGQQGHRPPPAGVRLDGPNSQEDEHGQHAHGEGPSGHMARLPVDGPHMARQRHETHGLDEDVGAEKDGEGAEGPFLLLRR